MNKGAQKNQKNSVKSFQEMLDSARQFNPVIDKIPMNPERFVIPGDEVHIGALENIEVISTSDDGRWVLVEHDATKRESNDAVKREQGVWPWTSVYKKNPNAVVFETDSVNHFMNHFSNTSLESIVNMFIFDRFRFDTEYQRDYAWSEDDKNRLLDSIFAGRDIGKFIFVKNPFPEKMDILDGKQRISTILDFYLGKIAYRGVKWHEISPQSQDVFMNLMIQKVELDGTNLKKSDLLKIFLNVNTGGVPQTPEHIQRVQNMLEKTLQEEAVRPRPKM